MMMKPKEPVRVALIGCGHRSNTIYKPLFAGLKPWMELVAVCDPVKEHADDYAADFENVRVCYDIQSLVAGGDFEAALVVAPIPLHHAYSVYLSSHKIHNLIETSWCNTLSQARDMIAAAKKNDVYTRVAENFYHYPIDRFAQTLRGSGYIGDIKRIFSYNDHTGYHNNSRWLVFSGETPLWINAIEHAMPTMEYYQTKERYYNKEVFRGRYIQFPGGLMVVDQAANIKGQLGRQVRPGFTEWHGSCGTLAQRGERHAAEPHWIYDNNGRAERGFGVHSEWVAEIRKCDDGGKNIFYEEKKPADANIISKVERYYLPDGYYAGVRACIPGGEINYVNPVRIGARSRHYFPEYGVAVASHMIDFALQVRGLKQSEFDEQGALMSMMMEVGARESILQNGSQIALPLTGELESDRIMEENLRKQFGVDPLDVEAMMSYKYSKP
ncbi:MAG: Gfo/Idh/MocA family protein [Christensenellales bacterium]|jgi:hypothetical protein